MSQRETDEAHGEILRASGIALPAWYGDTLHGKFTWMSGAPCFYVHTYWVQRLDLLAGPRFSLSSRLDSEHPVPPGPPVLPLTLDETAFALSFDDTKPDDVSQNQHFFACLNEALVRAGLRWQFCITRFKRSRNGFRVLLLSPTWVRRLDAVKGAKSFTQPVALPERPDDPKPALVPSRADLLAAARSLSFDGECVDHPQDYAGLIERIFDHFGWDRPDVTCEETVGRRTLRLRFGGRSVESELDGNTGWVDTKRLCAALNQVLGERAYLVQRRTSDQSVAFAALSRAQHRDWLALDMLDEWHTP